MSSYENPDIPITPEKPSPESSVQTEQPASGFYPSESDVVLQMRAAYREAGMPVPEYYS